MGCLACASDCDVAYGYGESAGRADLFYPFVVKQVPQSQHERVWRYEQCHFSVVYIVIASPSCGDIVYDFKQFFW